MNLSIQKSNDSMQDLLNRSTMNANKGQGKELGLAWLGLGLCLVLLANSIP